MADATVAALDGMARRALTGSARDVHTLQPMFAQVLADGLDKTLASALRGDRAERKFGLRWIRAAEEDASRRDGALRRAASSLARCRQFSALVDAHALSRVVKRVVAAHDSVEGGISALAAKESRAMALRLNKPSWVDAVAVADAAASRTDTDPKDEPGPDASSRKRPRGEAGDGTEAAAAADEPEAKRAALPEEAAGGAAGAVGGLGQALGAFRGGFDSDDDD